MTFPCFKNTVFIFVFCGLVSLCYGHVRFVCPRPQSSRSDVFQKLPEHPLDGQCGLSNTVKFESEYMEVKPGPFTVRFEETQVHDDSPFSISLHEYDDNSTSCLLLDHIPHNNDAKIVKGCHVTGYPIGQCTGSTYYITINIPNISCKKCYLQLRSVHVTSKDKGSRCEDSTCEVYYSCANIRIRPTGTGHSKDVKSCQRYSSNLLGAWPYRPQKYFKAELKAKSAPDPVLGTAIFDEVQNQIIAGLPRRDFQIGLYKVALSTLRNLSSTEPEYDILYSSPVSVHDYDGSRVNIRFRDIPHNITHQLINGEIYLNIFTETKEYIGVLVMKHEEYEEGQYGPLHARYNKYGWLSTPDFVGSSSIYSAGVYPSGSCAPPARHFISSLHVFNDISDTTGVLAMTVINEDIHVLIKLSDHKKLIARIELLPSPLSGLLPLALPIGKLRNGFLHVALNVPEYVQQVGTLMFFKKVEIRNSKNKVIFDGMIEEGIHSYIGDLDNVHGLGIFQITKGRFLQYTVVMEKIVCDKQYVLLQGVDSVIMSNLTSQILPLNDDYLITGYMKELSSDNLLNLWRGEVSLVMKCEKKDMVSEIIGKLTVPGDWYCNQIQNEECSITRITPGGKEVVHGETFQSPAGLAVFVLDRAKVLQYSIFIGDVTKRGILETKLIDEDHLVLTINLRKSQTYDHAFEAKGQLPQSSPALIKDLLLGRLKLHITNPGLGTKPLVGALPVIRRSECIETKTIVVGSDKEYWSYDSTPFNTIHALVGDKIRFIYKENTTVHLFKTREDFESCVMKNGLKLEGSTKDEETWTVTYVLTSGSNYFASEDKCGSSPPFKVAVSVIDDDKIVSSGGDECAMSLYEVWREEQLDKYSGPNVVGSAIGGIIAGVLVLVAFHLMERRNHNKMERTSSGFQRF